MLYDLIIIGGGPAAVSAGVYAARKRVKTLIITKDWGGQSKVSVEVQNFIGITALSGFELAERLEKHVKAYADDIMDFDEGSLVVKISKKEDNGVIFEVETDKGKKYQAFSLLVTSGSNRRKLNVPGAEKFDGKGVVYCASCDAPLFGKKDVAVIGGGNAGLESAQQLIEYANKIYILERGEEFKGDPVTREQVFASSKITPVTMAETLEIKGDKFVESLTYKDKKTNETKEIMVQGIFVEIGSIPSNEFVKGLVKTNEYGEIIIDHKTARASQEGIWAAGDITDQPYKQNNISMGDAVKALEDLYLWLQKRKV